MTPDPDRNAREAIVTPFDRRASFDSRIDAEGEEASAPTEHETMGRPVLRRRRVESTRTWLEGSRTARKWDTELIAWTALAIGTGAIVSVMIRMLLPTPSGSVLSAAVLWVAMAVPVVMAFRRGRPRGLLRFRWTDLLFAVALGGSLRIIQGWLALAAGDSGALPSYPMIDGRLPELWWLSSFGGPVVLSPLIEEFLFRGVILVAVYRIARRGTEGALLAVVGSTAAFVAMHVITSGLASWEQPVTLTLVGATCAALVLLTGRIWGAVLLHIVFNGSAVILALVGTALA